MHLQAFSALESIHRAGLIHGQCDDMANMIYNSQTNSIYWVGFGKAQCTVSDSTQVDQLREWRAQLRIDALCELDILRQLIESLAHEQ